MMILRSPKRGRPQERTERAAARITRREDRGLRPEPQLLRGREARTQRLQTAARGVPEPLSRNLTT